MLTTRDLRAISVDSCWDKISIQRPLNNVTSYGRLWRKDTGMQGSWGQFIVGIMFLFLFCFSFLQLSSADLFVEHKACVYLSWLVQDSIVSQMIRKCVLLLKAFLLGLFWLIIVKLRCQANCQATLGAPRTQNCRSLCVLEHRAIQVPPTILTCIFRWPQGILPVWVLPFGSLN